MDFLDQTIATWQPHSERPLTREDAREIAHNMMGFFRVLRDWAEEEKREGQPIGPSLARGSACKSIDHVTRRARKKPGKTGKA